MKKIFLASLFSFLFIFLVVGHVSAATCGDSATPGYSCMNVSQGVSCVSNLCPGGANNKCCKPKPVCGDSATPGYSCMDKSKGDSCVTGLCSGGTNNQCCKPKGASTDTPKGAETGTPQKKDEVKAKALPNPLGITSINSLAARLINFVLGIVGTISLVLFVYGGFTWMISAGSQEKVRKGRDIIVWAAIGMAVVFMAYTMVRFVIEGLQGL